MGAIIRTEMSHLFAELRRAFVFGVIFASSFGLSSAEAEETITLAVGQQRVLTPQPITRIATGNDKVIDVRVLSPSQVLVTGLAVGTSELTMWRGQSQTKYTFHVTAADARTVLRDVKKLLGDREGITLSLQGERVVLEGYALTLDDMQRVEQITQMYPQTVRNAVRLDPSAKNMVAQQVNSALQRAGLRGAIATVVGSTVFLEGKVENEGDMKKAELVIKSVGENVQNLLQIGSVKMIVIDVEFMEVATSSRDVVGIRYPLNVSGTPSMSFNAQRVFLPANVGDLMNLGGQVNVTSQFGFGFQFNDGVSRLLARPRLLCASGQKASFLAGGEIPYVIPTGLGATSVQFKEYGIRLNMHPVADARSIGLDVEAEVSEIDPSVTIELGGGKIPGLISRKVKTNIGVRSGETIALSGLLYNTSGKTVTKIPLLGNIPILGELFKSRDFIDRKTELIVFVTPRLVDPDDEALKQAITDMTERLDKASREVKWGVLD
jgi:pilus assembly protein CpaC